MASDFSIFKQLKERKLVQWALAYLAGAWAVLEAAGFVGDQFGWPMVVGQILIVAVIFGFLVTLVLAWYHGEKGRQRASGPELVMIAALLVVAGATVSMLRGRQPKGSIPTAPQATPATLPSLPTDHRPSVAVLPFANLSADPADAFLADGFHEAVLSQLAMVGGLKPLSRTSVMGYRDTNRNLREIAHELGAGFVLEGTVQRVRERLMIHTRLIEAVSDQTLWTQIFDEVMSLETQLDIQSGIARRVAEGLQTQLTPREDALLGARPTENYEAYQAFQRGQYYQDLPHFTEEDVTRAMREFERAVDLDSTFALAWTPLPR
ncbi:MAG: hypothetical protein MUO50_06700 [Longimicrobiales bacterium]|nr:hypothetical protein [Longimicrobiales bacterium]